MTYCILPWHDIEGKLNEFTIILRSFNLTTSRSMTSGVTITTKHEYKNGKIGDSALAVALSQYITYTGSTMATITLLGQSCYHIPPGMVKGLTSLWSIPLKLRNNTSYLLHYKYAAMESTPHFGSLQVVPSLASHKPPLLFTHYNFSVQHWSGPRE
ncbi:hypothetical protein BC827DRAFT_412387 [Russula dissimulans]|nr:hypothetical protein BC827DRAFT_412387 [Russula dissimulans]